VSAEERKASLRFRLADEWKTVVTVPDSVSGIAARRRRLAAAS
jgi:hypothetical protein